MFLTSGLWRLTDTIRRSGSKHRITSRNKSLSSRISFWGTRFAGKVWLKCRCESEQSDTIPSSYDVVAALQAVMAAVSWLSGRTNIGFGVVLPKAACSGVS